MIYTDDGTHLRSGSEKPCTPSDERESEQVSVTDQNEWLCFIATTDSKDETWIFVGTRESIYFQRIK
jgi:hypothetical protein